MILRVTFFRDLESMRKMLTNNEYKIFKIKSKILMNMLKSNFKKEDYKEFKKHEKDGFIINIEKETEAEILEQKKQLEALMYESKTPQGLEAIGKERFFRMMKRKFKTFNTQLFLKATSKTCVMNLLNMCGIMVNWEIVKTESSLDAKGC